MSPHRIQAVADGFNLYHSVRDAVEKVKATNEFNRLKSATAIQLSEQMKWLDIRRLCESYLPAIRERVRERVELDAVHYFSAFARHAGPDVVDRHMAFVSALTIHGVNVEMAKFKKKQIECRFCGKLYDRHEEKETDVAVGCKVVELAFTRACDSILLITGDSDIRPAVRLAKRLNPAIGVVLLSPYARVSVELTSLADQCFELDTKKYRQMQLPDPVILPNGDPLPRPAGW